MHRNSLIVGLAALLGIMVVMPEAKAITVTSLFPNTTTGVTVASNATGPTGTLLASLTQNYASVANPAFHGSVTEAVILDSETGHLTFVYQVHTAADTDVGSTRFTTQAFSDLVNISTQPSYGVGYTQTATGNATLTTAGFVNTTTSGGTAPIADRQNNGVGFQRTTQGELPRNAFSNILFIRTDATTFNGLGSLGLIDSGSTAEIKAYQPTAVPEPATFALALSGLPILAGYWLRRRRNPG